MGVWEGGSLGTEDSLGGSSGLFEISVGGRVVEFSS
jgi:hypothetical protein